MFEIKHYVGTGEPVVYQSNSAPAWVTSNAITFTDAATNTTRTVSGSFTFAPAVPPAA